MKKDLVFIASGGRTGTTFLGERLHEVVDDCFSKHEPDVLAHDWDKATASIREFGAWHMIFGRLLGQSGLRVLGHQYLAGKLREDQLIERMKRQRETWHASIDKPLIVESSWRYWMLAPVLQKAYPGSRLIGMVRDPREWIESWRRHQPRRHTKSFQIWFPLGPLTPAQIGDHEWADQWDSFDQFSRLAWDWRTITSALARAEESGDPVRVYRFEELFKSGSNGKIEELVSYATFDGKYSFSNLDGFTASVRNASSGVRVSWQDWEPEKAALVDAMCGDLMRRFGYGQEPEWRAKVEEAQALAKAA